MRLLWEEEAWEDYCLWQTRDKKLEQALLSCREAHKALGQQTKALLDAEHIPEKGANAMARGMSWLKTSTKLAVSPALVWLALTALGCDGVLLASCVIFAACPSGVIVSVLALQYGYDASYSSKGVLVTTVLSMLTLPLAAYILA